MISNLRNEFTMNKWLRYFVSNSISLNWTYPHIILLLHLPIISFIIYILSVNKNWKKWNNFFTLEKNHYIVEYCKRYNYQIILNNQHLFIKQHYGRTPFTRTSLYFVRNIRNHSSVLISELWFSEVLSFYERLLL